MPYIPLIHGNIRRAQIIVSVAHVVPCLAVGSSWVERGTITITIDWCFLSCKVRTMIMRGGDTSYVRRLTRRGSAGAFPSRLTLCVLLCVRAPSTEERAG